MPSRFSYLKTGLSVDKTLVKHSADEIGENFEVGDTLVISGSTTVNTIINRFLVV